MSFSERMGFKQPKQIQLNSLDDATRASLWNVCRDWVFKREHMYLKNDRLRFFATKLYRDFYKVPVDNLPLHSSDFVSKQQKFFERAKWFEVFDVVEFISKNLGADASNKTSFEHQINNVLEIEKSAYRFVGGFVTSLTSEVEIDEINKAVSLDDRNAPVSIHIRSALELFGKKPTPDYRNSIKEAISAVEAAANIINGKRATLGDALKRIEMHEALRGSMLKLYGFTSDEGGIRHALSDAPQIDEAEARYMLVTCSACANFLLSKGV